MEDTNIAQQYFEYLANEGYRPEIDADGDIRFKSEGVNLYIVINEKRPDFLQLLCPGFYLLENQAERQQGVNAALMTAREIMVTKLFIINDNVYASVEQFVDSAEQACNHFEKYLSALMTGVRRFTDKMQEETFSLAS